MNTFFLNTNTTNTTTTITTITNTQLHTSTLTQQRTKRKRITKKKQKKKKEWQALDLEKYDIIIGSDTPIKPSEPIKAHYIGLLQWYNPQKEFGFIQYDNNNASEDIFVHKSAFHHNQQIMNIIGHKVQFGIDIYYDKYNGKTKKRATNVTRIKCNDNTIILNSRSDQSINWRSNSTENTQNSLNDHNERPWRRPKQKVIKKQSYKGTLLWFNEKSKFGFISCDDEMKVNDDVFVHGSEFKCADCLIYKGQRLLFDIETYYEHGIEKRKAVDVILETDDDYIETKHTPQYRGVLLWFNITNKYGFIECQDKGIGDVFVYESELLFPKQLISDGIELQFDIKIYRNKYNGNQRTKAINVVLNKSNVQRKTFQQRTSKYGFSAHFMDKYRSNNIQKDETEVEIYTHKQCMVLPTIHEIEEIDDIASIKSVIEKKKKLKKETRRNSNSMIEKLFVKNKKKDNNHSLIAKQLFDILVQNDYDLEKILIALFQIKDKIKKSNTFLYTFLELLSLIEADQSIFKLIQMMDIIQIYITKLLCINYALDIYSECKDYGLQCIYPIKCDEHKVMNESISNNESIKTFISNKCYNFKNYRTMYQMMQYMMNKDDNGDIFEFMKRMVCNDDIYDIDNNDKLLLLSIIVSVLKNNYKVLPRFIKQIVCLNILSFEVIEKWRLDEYDDITEGKNKALIVLSDLLYELEMKEIEENDDATSNTDGDDDTDENILCAYISCSDLLQNNNNRNIHNQCPWKS